jgi:hypothetical protein
VITDSGFLKDPLLPHLLDIIEQPAAANLMLTGGFGLNLKRYFLAETRAETVVARSEWPHVRATQDLDFILKMSVFIETQRANDVANLLKGLGYQVDWGNLQFGKPLYRGVEEPRLVVDLISRMPTEGENVKSDGTRVGIGKKSPVHGRATVEAFAVDRLPIPVIAKGPNSAGKEVEAEVLVPHPFAWLMMKVRAAHDWHEEREGRLAVMKKRRSPKHAFDVMLIASMMTLDERQTASVLAQEFRDHPEATKIRDEAVKLFSLSTSPGCVESRRQAGRELDYRAIWETLARSLGI